MRSQIDMMVRFIFFSPPVDKDKICSAPTINAEKPTPSILLCRPGEKGAHLPILSLSQSSEREDIHLDRRCYILLTANHSAPIVRENGSVVFYTLPAIQSFFCLFISPRFRIEGNHTMYLFERYIVSPFTRSHEEVYPRKCRTSMSSTNNSSVACFFFISCMNFLLLSGENGR
jgi:hypothetical protein